MPGNRNLESISKRNLYCSPGVWEDTAASPWSPCCHWLLSTRGFGFNVVRNLRQSHTMRVRKRQPSDDAASFPDQRDCTRVLYLVISICLWELLLPHKSHRKSLKILSQKATMFSFSVKRSRARNSFLRVSARMVHLRGRSESVSILHSETFKSSAACWLTFASKQYYKKLYLSPLPLFLSSRG